MEQRPKLQIPLTIIDKSLEVAGYLLLFLLWLFVITRYANLPDTIPTHYNLEGQADGFGNKKTIFFLPIIGTFLFIGISYVSTLPHTFNYPRPITKENALNQYSIARQMMRVLKLALVIIFGIIAYQTLKSPSSESISLGVWFLPLALSLVIVPMIYFIRKQIRMA
jgi:uncharacterized membrane protein